MSLFEELEELKSKAEKYESLMKNEKLLSNRVYSAIVILTELYKTLTNNSISVQEVVPVVDQIQNEVMGYVSKPVPKPEYRYVKKKPKSTHKRTKGVVMDYNAEMVAAHVLENNKPFVMSKLLTKLNLNKHSLASYKRRLKHNRDVVVTKIKGRWVIAPSTTNLPNLLNNKKVVKVNKNTARANKIIELVLSADKSFRYCDLTRKFDIPDGGSSQKVLHKLEKSKQLDVIHSTKGRGSSPIIAPRGYTFKNDDFNKRELSAYNKFFAKRVPYYVKMGYDRQTAVRLMSADWHRFGKYQDKHHVDSSEPDIEGSRRVIENKTFGKIEPKMAQDEFPHFESLSSDSNIIVKTVLSNAMRGNHPITFLSDGRILGIDQIADWVKFVDEVLSNSKAIKAYFGDTSNRKWVYDRRNLWFK